MLLKHKINILVSCILITFIQNGEALSENFASNHDTSLEHLKEHFNNKIDLSGSTNAEHRTFLYFQIGDTNNDFKLDGLEIFKLVVDKNYHDNSNTNILNVESFENAADKVLSDLDKDNDGFVDFREYSAGLHEREIQK